MRGYESAAWLPVCVLRGGRVVVIVTCVCWSSGTKVGGPLYLAASVCFLFFGGGSECCLGVLTLCRKVCVCGWVWSLTVS